MSCFWGLAKRFFRHLKQHENNNAELERVTSTLFWFLVACGTLFGLVFYSGSEAILNLLVSPHPLALTCYYLAIASVLMRLLNGLATSYLQAMNRSILLAGTILFGSILFCASNVWYLAIQQEAIDRVFWARALFAFTPTILVGIYLLRPYIRFRFDVPLFKKMVRFSYPFILTVVAYQILNFFDRWMLDRLVSPEATGIYGISYRFGMIPNMILVTPFLRAWQPAMYEKGKLDVREAVYQRTLLYYTLCGCLLWLGLSVFRLEILQIASTPPYYSGNVVIPFVAASQFFYGLGWIMVAGLAFEGKTLFIGLSTFAAALLNIGLNYLLIPPLGLLGAAITTTISFVALSIAFALYTRRSLPFRWPFRRLITMFGISLVSFFILDRYTIDGLMPTLVIKSVFLLPTVFLLIYLSGLTWAKIRSLFPSS